MKFRIFTIIALLLLSANAWAVYQADLTYNYTNSGSTYTFDVTVHNTSTGGDTARLDLFQIYLNADSTYANYQNLAWNSYNSALWSSDLSNYNPGFSGVPGTVVAFTTNFGDGIDQGNSLGQFKFSFDYSGALGPADQLFGYYATFGSNLTGGIPVGADPLVPDYYITADTAGFLAPESQNPPTVPEPSTMLLFGLGLSAAVCLRRKLNR